jgi:hypothetical protein
VAEWTLSGALNRALRDALAEDPRVLVFGEDVGRSGGVFRVTDGLQAEFGAERVFDLSLGNPVAEPPEAFRRELERLVSAPPAGMHRYMPNQGYEETRAAVAARHAREQGVDVGADGVVMTVGAAGGLNVLFHAILDPGSEVVLLAPGLGRARGPRLPRRARIVYAPSVGGRFAPHLYLLGALPLLVLLALARRPDAVYVTDYTASAPLALVLRLLGLRHLREHWAALIETARSEKPSYGRWLKDLVLAEAADQRERLRQARITRAHIPEAWVMETFPFDRQPQLKKRVVRELYDSLEFMKKPQDLIFIGPTGCGKSGLATSYLIHALNQGHRGVWIDFKDLLDRLWRAIGDGTEKRLVKRFAAYDVLAIDELGYTSIRKEQAGLFPGGHLKTDHSWPGQNRPAARRLVS